jgi:hypothetical protein
MAGLVKDVAHAQVRMHVETKLEAVVASVLVDSVHNVHETLTIMWRMSAMTQRHVPRQHMHKNRLKGIMNPKN